jgi:hypothetical protein
MATLRRQIELESFFLISIVAAASLFLVVSRNNPPQFNIVLNTPIASTQAEVVSPKITIFSQISPDGTKKVIMKTTENSDNTITYDFSTADENSVNEQPVFSKVLVSSESIAIPFNTWSPDNKYFFMQENSAGNKNVLVFKGSGDQFADTQKYLDATDSFNQKNTGNNFGEATGWASESLIIINTTKADGKKGPSYWFEVPSKAIIQLSTEF